MVERLTYRKKLRYNTASNKQKRVKTPGGKLVLQQLKKKASPPKCGDCGKNIIGVPTMRPTEYRRLKKRERRVNRAYGGSRCAFCTRTRVMRAFLIEEQKCVKQVLSSTASAADDSHHWMYRVLQAEDTVLGQCQG
jgi:large subunit ribosomal protein L34e